MPPGKGQHELESIKGNGNSQTDISWLLIVVFKEVPLQLKGEAKKLTWSETRKVDVLHFYFKHDCDKIRDSSCQRIFHSLLTLSCGEI